MTTYQFIYKITNLINGKSYIGKSKDPEKRWKSHKDPDKFSYIANAIKKYGENNFKFEIIEKCESDITASRECFWIEYYNTFKYIKGGYGYNCTKGGEGGDKSDSLGYQNYIHSKERIDRLKSRKWWTKETKDIHCEFPPDDTWVLGRNNFINNGAQAGADVNKEKIWINNGTIEKMSTDIEEGFNIGRLKNWWTDGIKDAFCNECPEGFYLGRGDKTSKASIGKHWWTNSEEENKFQKLSPGEGWIRGRSKTKNQYSKVSSQDSLLDTLEDLL